MIKKMALAVLASAVVCSTAFAAPDRTGKWDAGLFVAAGIPDDSDMDAGAYVGGTVAYGVTDWFAVGFESGWVQFDESDLGIDWKDNVVPIFGDLIARLPINSPIQPYGVIGLGALVWNVDQNVSNLDVDVETSFAAKFGGGVDWFINDRWIANFEFSYVDSDADATFTNTSTGATATLNSETDYWTVGGGLKYLF